MRPTQPHQILPVLQLHAPTIPLGTLRTTLETLFVSRLRPALQPRTPIAPAAESYWDDVSSDEEGDWIEEEKVENAEVLEWERNWREGVRRRRVEGLLESEFFGIWRN